MANNLNNIVTPFNSQEIIKKVSQFSTTMVDNNVNTYLGDSMLRTTKVSDRYKMFNFSDFVSGFIPSISDVFTPETYKLKINGGKQELALKGESVIVNGEEWNKMVWILNSTDKSRALSLSMGLFRVICTNGMIAQAPGSQASVVRVKHLVSNNIEDKVNYFMNSLENADAVFNSSVNMYEGLNDKTFSIGYIASQMGIDTPTQVKRFGNFTNKLVTSTTDGMKGLSIGQIEGLRTPYYRMGEDTLNMEVNGYRALQCYTEMYRNRDAGKIQRETQRIVNVLTA